jgi:DinB superfamily
MTGIELTNPTAYQQKLARLLGDRDPLAVLADTPAALARIIGAHTAAQMRSRPFEGKWTPNEILGHLCDQEWAFGWRIRHGLCDEHPACQGYDQERWVDRQRHNEVEPARHLETLRAMRQSNLALWRTATAQDLARAVMHNERGPETLGLMLQMHAGHDLAHLDQIRRYLAAAARPAGR